MKQKRTTRQQRRNPVAGVPGVAKWDMFAGGTSAAPGKHSYSITTDKGKYYIWPYTTRTGRHAGYLLKRSGGPGVGLWKDLGSHRSPAAAAVAARKEYNGLKEDSMANPGGWKLIKGKRQENPAKLLQQFQLYTSEDGRTWKPESYFVLAKGPASAMARAKRSLGPDPGYVAFRPVKSAKEKNPATRPAPKGWIKAAKVRIRQVGGKTIVDIRR